MNALGPRVMLSYLYILVGYPIFGTYALSLRFKFIFPIELYWFSFVFVSIPLLFEAASWKFSGKLRLFYLLSFSLMVHLQFAVVDSSPFLSSEDAVGARAYLYGKMNARRPIAKSAREQKKSKQ